MLPQPRRRADTLLEALRYGVGPHNVAEASAHDIMGNFNEYAKSLVLRINEARDLGGEKRVDFYNRCKNLMAPPPLSLKINEKNKRPCYAANSSNSSRFSTPPIRPIRRSS
jgi:hypothetical protein